MDTNKSVSKRFLFLAIASVALIIMGSMAYNALTHGQDKAREIEQRNVQQAVFIMMTDNLIYVLPNPVTEPTNDMTLFPDATTSPEAKGMLSGDRPGYVLRDHDTLADDEPGPPADYVGSQYTRWTYSVTRAGIVVQVEKIQ